MFRAFGTFVAQNSILEYYPISHNPYAVTMRVRREKLTRGSAAIERSRKRLASKRAGMYTLPTRAQKAELAKRHEGFAKGHGSLLIRCSIIISKFLLWQGAERNSQEPSNLSLAFSLDLLINYSFRLPIHINHKSRRSPIFQLSISSS